MKQTTSVRATSFLSSRLRMTWKISAIFCMATFVSKSATSFSDNKRETYGLKISKQIKAVNNAEQKISIKGTVKDAAGIPIPGANVLVKGTTIGTITDLDGNYSIVIPENSNTLVFSYIGFKTTEVAINGKSVVNISLKSDAATLDEVVVVGYGTVKKSDLTGSLSSVNTKDISKTQNTNIAQAIQGRAAGVTITKSSGAPGDTPTIRIRGVGTVNNADPLYIVDGVPINDISSINMEDAKSVEILKDASATAIYGSRGANGVVLITTKSGKKGVPVISYKTYTGIQKRIDNLQVLNVAQWATLYNEANVNDGTAAVPALANPASLVGYNWKDAVYRAAMMQSHQLSVSGGTDKISYYVSFGYVNQDGIITNTSYDRTNFRINNSYQITPKIKFGHNIQYAKSNSNTLGLGSTNSFTKAPFSGYMIEPITPFYNADGSLGLPAYTVAVNPIGLTKYTVIPSSKETFYYNFYVEADVMKGLKFKSNYGLEINNTNVDNFEPAFYISPANNSPLSTYNLSRAQNRVMVLSNTLNYNTTIAKKHNINAMLGQEVQDSKYNNVVTNINNIPSSVANPTIGSGDASSATVNGNISESKLLSFFGRLNYNYDERYLLTGSYRFDGSSNFGANNKWAEFPSLALGWNIHKEAFYHIDFINQLKLRLGWGETGNQNIPNGATSNTLNIGTNYLYGPTETTALGVAPLQPGNPNLKWETTVSKNIGIDLGMLHNTITFTAEYFIKNTNNMLMAAPILATSGYANFPYVNAGNIENKGFEFTANYKKIINDFSFNVGGNISFIKNNVLSLASPGQIISTGASNGFKNISVTQVDHPLASFYGYQMIGIFQNQNEINGYASLPGTKPGDVKYKDITPDGVIDANDQTFIGSPFPKFTYGINLDLTYKQFDFSAFFQGSQGNKIFNATDFYLMGDLASNSNVNVLNRWTGDGTSNSIPRATFLGAANNDQISSRFVQDGSYLRLKNVQIGYTLPKLDLKKMAIENLRIYLAAQNLLTFTHYDGMDPEVGVDPASNASPLDIGIDRGRYPSVRTFSMGLDINF